MNMQIVKTSGVVYPPIFKAVLEDIPGGVLFDVDDLPAATEFLEAGVLLAEDGSTSGLFHACKTAKVYEAEAAGGTELKVTKDHLFIVGDFITNGDVSTAITAIDTTTSALYDTLTLTATLDAIIAVPINLVVYQGSSETSNAPTSSTCQVTAAATQILDIADPMGGSNGVTVTLADAGNDTLAIAYNITTRTLTISLADTTASKNNVSAILALVIAQKVLGGVDFTNWTFTSDGWDGNADGDVAFVTASDRMVDGVELAARLTALYSPSCILANQIDVSIANPSGSAVVRGTVNESILPYSVHADQKTALTDLIRFD